MQFGEFIRGAVDKLITYAGTSAAWAAANGNLIGAMTAGGTYVLIRSLRVTDQALSGVGPALDGMQASLSTMTGAMAAGSIGSAVSGGGLTWSGILEVANACFPLEEAMVMLGAYVVIRWSLFVARSLLNIFVRVQGMRTMGMMTG